MRRILFLSTITIAASVVASGASAQQVIRQSNGDYNVGFPGPCTVHYNRNFTLESVDRSCTPYQRMQAQQAIDAFRGSAYPGYPNYPPSRAIRIPGYPAIRNIRSPASRDARNPGNPQMPSPHPLRPFAVRRQLPGLLRLARRRLQTKGGCITGGRRRRPGDGQLARQSGYTLRRRLQPGGSWNDIMLLPSYDGGLHVRFTTSATSITTRAAGDRADAKCTRTSCASGQAAAIPPGIRLRRSR